MNKTLDNMQAAALSHMMDPAGPPAPAWSQEDLRAMLAHQLATPLVYDLSADRDSHELLGRLHESADRDRLPCFADLLADRAVPVELLTLVKRFAKAQLKSQDDALPREIASVLYYAAIAAGLRTGVRVTHLDDAQLRAGLKWVVQQPWVDPTLQSLCSQAAEHI